MEKIAEKLREIITREGQDYLEDYPWDVYKELKEDKLGKKEILAVVLMTLVIGMSLKNMSPRMITTSL